MQNRFKKAAALTMAAIMVFSLSAFAAPPSEMVPLRATFEASGADVQWHYDGGFITVNIDGEVFTFNPSHGTAYRNGTSFPLSSSVTVSNGVSFISQADVNAILQVPAAGYQEPVTEQLDTEPFALARATAIEHGNMLAEVLDVAGITIALVDRDTGFTWTHGIGYADIENGLPVDEMTMFDVGSISKTFTAIAVMQLVEEGIIDLDEPITTYLPNFFIHPHPTRGGDYRGITTRMLLSHVSGIAADIITGMGSEGQHDTAYMNNIVDNLAQMHMTFPSLYRMSYANTGYTLLGVLVASVMGYEDYFSGFENHMLENIFAPLSMYRSVYDVRGMQNVARPYPNASSPAAERLLANPISTGGLYSSAYDMARFMHVLLNGGSHDGITILSQNSVRQMAQVQNFNFLREPMYKWGLGLYQFTMPNGFVSVGHSGGWTHFHSDMQFCLDSGVGVFVSANTMGSATSLAVEILMAAVYEKTGSVNVLDPLPPGVPVERSAEDLERFTGWYTGAVGRINLSDDGVLYAPNVLGMPGPLEFTPYADGSFGTAISRFWFEEISGTMILFQGDHRLMPAGERMDNLWQADETFARWVGEYYYHGTIAEFAIDEDGYAVSIWGGLAFPMIGVDEYTFYVAGTTRGYGQTVQFFENENGSWFVYSNTRFDRQ